MRRHGFRYVLADVFTDQPFGGNPLAVFPDADGIPEALMPRIAGELNLSETVFVLSPTDPRHVARLRIFTPGSELPFAGHPTVGTACVLASEGRVTAGQEFILEMAAGFVPVRVEGEGPVRRADFDVPRLPERPAVAPAREILADLLSLDVGDLDVPGWRPEIWSCGVPFLVVPVRDRSALRRARLDLTIWEESIAGSGGPHVYVVTPDAELPTSTLRARMFAPAMGIVEDPATGAAASALAGALAARDPATAGRRTWRIEQGFEMGRPSVIEVKTVKSSGKLTGVRIGGACLMMGEGRLYSI